MQGFIFVYLYANMTSTPKHLIVYAEDDADDRELMAEAFEKYKEQVELVLFHDGAAILRYLTRLGLMERKPCLIILDLNMPIADGQEVTRQLRSMPPYAETPVMFFTTSSQNRDLAFAERYGAGFMTKPLTHAQMDGITEKLIDACDHSIQYAIRSAL